jgi:hypothetical protein
MVATAIARIIDSVSRYKAVIHDKPLVPASETEVKFGELHVSLKG